MVAKFILICIFLSLQRSNASPNSTELSKAGRLERTFLNINSSLDSHRLPVRDESPHIELYFPTTTRTENRGIVQSSGRRSFMQDLNNDDSFGDENPPTTRFWVGETSDQSKAPAKYFPPEAAKKKESDRTESSGFVQTRSEASVPSVRQAVGMNENVDQSPSPMNSSPNPHQRSQPPSSGFVSRPRESTPLPQRNQNEDENNVYQEWPQSSSSDSVRGSNPSSQPSRETRPDSTTLRRQDADANEDRMTQQFQKTSVRFYFHCNCFLIE